MDEFLVLLQAKLDEAKSKENINKTDIPNLQTQLDKLKIQVELDPKSAQKLADDIGKLINQKIVISNIGVDQSNLSKTGQQVGQIISDSAEKAISNVSSKNIGKYFKVSSSDSRQFQAEMEKLVSGWTNGKGKVTDINIQTRTSYDKDAGENIERLHQATVTYKNELDEVIKKTIAWRQIGTTTNAKGEEEILRGFVEVAGQYSKSIDTVSVKTDNFVEKQKKAVADLTNKLNKYYKEGIDQGSSKPIKDQSHLTELKQRYDEIVTAIGKVGSASKSSFGDEQNSVNTLISDLQILIKEYKNAETVATSLRSKDISTVKSEYSSKLDNLVTKMKSSGLYSDGFQKGANNLSNILKNATDASGLTSFLNGLDKLDAGYKRAKVSAEAFNQSQKVGIKVSGLQSKIDDLQRISPEIDKFKTQINGAEVSVQSLCDDLSKVSTQSDLSVVNEKWRAFRDAAKAAGIAVTEVATNSQSLTNKINEIQLSTDVDTLTTKYQKFGVVSKEVEDNLKDLRLAKEAVLDSKNDENPSVKIEQYNEALKRTKASITELTTQEVSLYKRTAQMDGMRNWMLKNKAAVKLVGDEVDKLIKECETCDSIRFEGIKREFRELQTQAREAGKLGNSLWGSIKEQFAKFTQWFSVTSLVTNVLHAGRQMYDAVYDIDTAMTNLYKVTDETSQKYNQFLESSSKSAHELGRSISSLVEQTANWAKLGFSLDEAEQLAKISSIYANVGEVDNDTAVSDMVTAMKAFNIEASDSITIVDMLNKLGNEFATSAASLGDGLSRSASAMATSGTDINKTLAMLTGGTEITQNASEFGNFLKIGSMRIRGMKGSLEELGEEVDETVDSISKVQTQILNRTGGKVNIFDDMGNFRDYYDIMKDISEVYDELSDTDKADLTEILFGKQRGNQGAALIQAFQSGQIQKALEATLNAEGSAMEEQKRWMDSLEAKTQQFDAAFQSLSSTVLDSNLLKWFVDLGTSGVQALDYIIDKIGIIKPLLLGVGITQFVKSFD